MTLRRDAIQKALESADPAGMEYAACHALIVIDEYLDKAEHLDEYNFYTQVDHTLAEKDLYHFLQYILGRTP